MPTPGRWNLQRTDYQRDSELPVLKIAPVANLVLHEYTDPDRIQGLVDRLEQDGLLKNPPIVAPIPGGHTYVVLDGANRVSALAKIGCRDALVQVVDYGDPDLDLAVWNHLIAAPRTEDVVEHIQTVAGLRVRRVGLPMARALLANRGVLAYLLPVEGPVLVLEGGLTLEDEAEVLNKVVNTYHGRLRYFRVKSDELKPLLPYYDGVAALLAFPVFQPADITHLAANGAKLPAGITRHVIPQRALRVNVPLSVLFADRPLEEKNAWLLDQIKQRLLNRHIRFYQEPTVLFDE